VVHFDNFGSLLVQIPVMKIQQRYCADADFKFDLPLKRPGTAFQQSVWDAISSIPRGSVRTYGQVAKLHRFGAARGRPGLRRQLVPAGRFPATA
jgi:hypothetical protein